MQTVPPELPIKPNLTGQVRSFDICSPFGLVAGAAALFGFGCLFLFLPATAEDGSVQHPWWIGCVICLLACARLGSIYRVQVQGNRVQFFGIFRVRNVSEHEICQIVRCEVDDGRLTDLVIRLTNGSVKLHTGLEDVCRAIRDVKPSVSIRSEKYDAD